MDRERLKEVHQTDLTESKVNEDFVDWMKTKGPTWLLAILVAVCAYLFMVRFRQGKENHKHEAWAAVMQPQLPSSLEDVAEEYGDIGSVGQLARLEAANLLVLAVQQGRSVEALAPDADTTIDYTLTTEQRDGYLSRADRLAGEVVSADDNSDGMAIHAICALNLQASIAESRGDAAKAAELFEQAAKRADARFPGLAAQARSRAANVDEFLNVPDLPTEDEVTSLRQAAPARVGINVDDSIRDLVFPPTEADEDDETAGNDLTG